MKKFIYVMLTCLLFSSFSITTYARNLGPTGQDNNPSEDDGSGGGGGPSGPVIDTPGGCSTHIEILPDGTFTYDHDGQCDNSTAFTPVVTALHSVNGILANAGEAVYFIPSLEDFPVDLVDACADITTYDGKRHQFAVVYDGYFDIEAKLSATVPDNWDTTDVGRVQTSKRVYSSTDNSRCLNLLGYDLLLANEQLSLVSNGPYIQATYYPTLVGTAPLTTKTIMMDLYKAVGQIEWDIKVTHGIDNDLAINTSPIMQMIPVELSGQKEGGIWTNEGATYVWATRTNPDIYWTRCKRDAIFDGGAHKYTADVYVGNDVSVAFSKTESSYMTMAEFLQVARAVMELYGESVLSEVDLVTAKYEYGTKLPSIVDEDTKEDILYLAAKGIIEPDKLDYQTNVTFADIEPILLRIADKSSRLTIKSDINYANTMVQHGYSETDVLLGDGAFTGFETIINPYDSDYYDYFVEAVDGVTNFYLKKLSGINYEEQPNYEPGPTTPPDYVGEVPTPPIPDSEAGQDYVFAADKLVLATEDDSYTTPGSGVFENLGMVKLFDKYYYHFKIARDVEDVTILYNADPLVEELLDITSYTLPTAEGGVYNCEGGIWSHNTFDEAGFDNYFLDKSRVSNPLEVLETTESYLSDTWNWYLVTFPEADFTAQGDNVSLLSSNVDNVTVPALSFGEAKTNAVIKLETDVWEEPSDGQCTVYIEKPLAADASSVYRVLFQTKCDENEILAHLTTQANGKMQKNLFKGYYQNDDGVLLVSVSALKNAGKVTASDYIADKDTVVLCTKVGNVYIRGKEMVLIIGDTMVAHDSSEDLYWYDGKELYVNYKAVEGWTGQLCYTVTNNVTIPYFPTWGKGVVTNFSNKNVKIPFPSSSLAVKNMSIRADLASFGSHSGLSMYSTYPLANYMIVYGPNGDDKLFVWHYKEVKLPDGSMKTFSDERSSFESMTGISLSGVHESYALVSYDLNRNHETLGFKFIEHSFVNSNFDYGTVDYGYLYTPHSYSNITDALQAYHSGSDDCVIPIAQVGGKYVDVNMNICRDLENNSLFPVGQLPFRMSTNSKRSGDDSVMGIWKQYSKEEKTSTTFDDLDNIELVAAPTGIFTSIRGLNSYAVGNLRKNTPLYFGSSLCKFSNKKDEGVIAINGYETAMKATEQALMSYKEGNSGVFVLDVNQTALGDILEDVAVEIETAIEDPQRMFDWDEYTFSRLVENMDGWTSVALIFILNILPRVCMLLFFVLMLLALIKNFRLWRMFCERVFDIYSFLSFGKMNVNTVDTKRLVIISMICLAIFSVIMDGLLFKFIIWVCEWFIVLWQR